MLIFEDRTAIGDPIEIQRTLLSRKLQAEQFAGVIEDLDSIASAENPIKAAEERTRELASGKALDRNGKPMDLTSATTAQGRMTVRTDLQAARAQGIKVALSGTNGDKVKIAAKLEDLREHVRVLRLHSTLMEVAQ
jgi:hypothetical protein